MSQFCERITSTEHLFDGNQKILALANYWKQTNMVSIRAEIFPLSYGNLLMVTRNRRIFRYIFYRVAEICAIGCKYDYDILPPLHIRLFIFSFIRVHVFIAVNSNKLVLSVLEIPKRRQLYFIFINKRINRASQLI